MQQDELELPDAMQDWIAKSEGWQPKTRGSGGRSSVGFSDDHLRSLASVFSSSAPGAGQEGARSEQDYDKKFPPLAASSSTVIAGIKKGYSRSRKKYPPVPVFNAFTPKAAPKARVREQDTTVVEDDEAYDPEEPADLPELEEMELGVELPLQHPSML